MKIAMVTGAGSGIGQAASLALLHAGYAVVLAGRRGEALEQTISQAPKDSVKLAVPTDVRDEDSVAALFQTALGALADATSISFVYKVCAFLPLIGLLTVFLPNLKSKKA